MGYSQAELEAVQARWDLRFPPDLVELLREHRPLPLPGCFDWLTTDAATIQTILDWPFDSFWFDVQHGRWWPEWGEKPSSPDEQHDRLKQAFAAAPRLIPLCGHRYLPQEPFERGNPVFSVYQMDVICYGVDLADWIERERDGWAARPWRPIKEICFWSEALRKNHAEPASS
jgi:hypothetical protein